MRWHGLVVWLVGWLAASVADAKPSNPAFLGIGMHDVQGQQAGTGQALGPCMVDTITRGSGAKAAGLQSRDLLITIDGTAVTNCDAVLKVVQSHEPGDTVKIKVDRMGRPVVLTASLVSRDEILRRRFVGQSMGATQVFGADDQRGYDLGSLRGKTAIVGWFDVACTECRSVFTKLADWSRAQAGKPGVQLMPLAVMAGDPDVPTFRGMNLDVPLAIADRELYEEFTIPDKERINFMIVDCRGVVQYVAPIAPNSDDTDAVLDELFAAAEQASRRAGKSSAR